MELPSCNWVFGSVMSRATCNIGDAKLNIIESYLRECGVVYQSAYRQGHSSESGHCKLDCSWGFSLLLKIPEQQQISFSLSDIHVQWTLTDKRLKTQNFDKLGTTLTDVGGYMYVYFTFRWGTVSSMFFVVISVPTTATICWFWETAKRKNNLILPVKNAKFVKIDL